VLGQQQDAERPRDPPGEVEDADALQRLRHSRSS
jgi:hypothetical protein